MNMITGSAGSETNSVDLEPARSQHYAWKKGEKIVDQKGLEHGEPIQPPQAETRGKHREKVYFARAPI